MKRSLFRRSQIACRYCVVIAMCAYVVLALNYHITTLNSFRNLQKRRGGSNSKGETLETNGLPSLIQNSSVSVEYTNIWPRNQMSANNNTVCDYVERPLRHDILWRNDAWQYLTDKHKSFYVLKTFYDNRHGLNLVRIFVSLAVPVEKTDSLSDDGIYALLWYPTQLRPLSVQAVREDDRGIKVPHPFWQIEGQQLTFVHYSVQLPYRDVIPTHLSLATSSCPNATVTTYVEVVVPRKPTYPSKTIGACVKSLFGNLTRDNATYLVSWLESMRYFGVERAHISYDDLAMADIIEKIFDYYIKEGFITFERIPHNLYETNKSRVDARVSQSVVLPISNNCFYSHLYDYEYTLHLDYDEIFVPRYKTNYANLIANHMKAHQQHRSTCSVCSRSAFFYFSYPPASPEQPESLPVFQYTYRQPTEIPGVTWRKGVGVRKCFQSNRYSRYMFIHNSYPLRGGILATNFTYLDPDDEVLIHHYRQRCKLYERCATEEERRFKDETLNDLFGDELKPRIEAVLKDVGFFS